MGFVRLPNEWADELCESPKLLAVVRLLRTRNYETGELTESVRTLSATTGLTTWQCREAIAYVTERIKAESAQIPHSMSHKIRTAESATDKGSGESAAQIPHTPPQDFRTQNKIQDSTKATTKNIYPLSFEGVWARYPKTNGSKADAFKAFQKANPNTDALQQWLTAIDAQKTAKTADDRRGVFHPEFPYLERWIKGKRWENVPKVDSSEAKLPTDAFTTRIL